MADERGINGGYSDDRGLEISGDGIDQRIAHLENKNAAIIRENKEHRKQIEELKASVEKLHAENERLQKEVDTTDSDNKVLEVAMARTVELEKELSRLQQDLASATSDLKDSTSELSTLKKELEGMKGGEKENDKKLEAFEKEKASLLAKIEKMGGVESTLWKELQGKEKEIRALKKNVEELEAIVASGKVLEMGKSDLEMCIVKMREENNDLKSRLAEKEKLLELKKRATGDGNNLSTAEDGGGKKNLIGGVNQRDLVIVGGSAIAAVAAIGVACCTHAVRKH